MPVRGAFGSFLTLLSVGLIFLLGIGGVFAYAAHLYLSKSFPQADQTIIIKRGQGVNEISALLDQNKIISSPLVFKIAVRVTGRHGGLKAGEYLIPAQTSMKDILDILHEGRVMARKFTIVEGLTSYQILTRLYQVKFLTGEKIKNIPAEGSLLPETYHYISGETYRQKIDEMRAAMTKTIDTLWQTRAKNLPFKTKEEALTLASIVEKETGIAGERKKIAGVFINRLRRGILLQSDPTVIYALTKGKIHEDGKGPLGRRLLRKDLGIDSPYNTYKYAGLPPGPIANPGAAAIKAVLHPAQHEYIYFVADGSGGHAFSKTLAEHNQNVAKWRKFRRDNKK